MVGCKCAYHFKKGTLLPSRLGELHCGTSSNEYFHAYIRCINYSVLMEFGLTSKSKQVQACVKTSSLFDFFSIERINKVPSLIDLIDKIRLGASVKNVFHVISSSEALTRYKFLLSNIFSQIPSNFICMEFKRNAFFSL